MNAFVKKLRINAELPLLVLNLPRDCDTLLGDQDFRTTVPRTGKISQLIFFAKDSATLASKFVPLVPSLSDDPLVWIIYPKKSGRVKSDLSMTTGWKPAFDTGLTGVSSASVNDDWSALRLRPEAKVMNTLASPALRQTEGIDYVARTVLLPADAIHAMRKLAGMETFFNAMAFTHKKEYVEAIVAAKKPETRERRIQKMIEMLAAGMKLKSRRLRQAESRCL